MDDDLAGLGVDGRNHLVDANRVREALRKLEIGTAVFEERRADDDLARAGRQHVASTLGRPDAAANPARQRRRDLSNDRQVVAGTHCRVEIDDLHLREAFEAAHPLEDVFVANREPLALDKLDDRAALKIDRWNQHRGSEAYRNTSLLQVLLQRSNARLGVMKDRR